MKTKKESLFQKLIVMFRKLRSQRQYKDLNTMVVYSFDAAVKLAERKRDIVNHKCWVVPGAGIFLVFLRYQKKQLQSDGFLKPNVTFKNLDDLASYVAMPIDEKNRSRKGILRKFKGERLLMSTR